MRKYVCGYLLLRAVAEIDILSNIFSLLVFLLILYFKLCTFLNFIYAKNSFALLWYWTTDSKVRCHQLLPTQWWKDYVSCCPTLLSEESYSVACGFIHHQFVLEWKQWLVSHEKRKSRIYTDLQKPDIITWAKIFSIKHWIQWVIITGFEIKFSKFINALF